MLFLFYSNPLLTFSQKIIQKTIFSEKDKIPLPFVHIYIKSSGNGTYSNTNGQFQLKVYPEDTLTLSSIGFKTSSYSVESIKNDTLFLREEVNILNEVVISKKREKPDFEMTGFHKYKRDRSFTGSNAVALLIDNNSSLTQKRRMTMIPAE